MTRFDIYRLVHKGIRSLLFDAATLVARTDFTDPPEATAAATALRRLFGFLDEHAAHEDASVMPELRVLSPELHGSLQSEHARLRGQQGEIERLLDRLPGATDAERVSLGARLHLRVARLCADQLLHLEREETEANRMLWAHRTDAELRALHARFVASVPHARLGEVFAFVLPALSRPERDALLGDLRAALPPSLFQAVTSHARAGANAVPA